MCVQKMVLSLKRITMTDPRTSEPQFYNWMDWERAALLERAGHRSGTDDISSNQFMTCVLLTPAEFYSQLVEELGELISGCEQLEEVLDKRTGEPGAALWQFRQVATNMRDFAQKALNQKKAEEAPADELDESIVDEELADDAGEVVMSAGTGGPIRNRADAYQRLAEVSSYLMRKEPHSPVPHLVKRAVAWGNMSFGELITELVQDHGDLKSIYALLGMQLPDE